jgi:hypothetical protein
MGLDLQQIMIRNPFRPAGEELPPKCPPGCTPTGFDREKFIYKLLGAIIMAQLTLYSGVVAACGERMFRHSRDVEKLVCDKAMVQLQKAFGSSLELLVALLAGHGMADRKNQ